MTNAQVRPIGPHLLDVLNAHFYDLVAKLAEVDSAADRLKLAAQLEHSWEALRDAYREVAF